MYSFSLEQEKEIQNNGKILMGQELKLGELCETLNIKKPSGTNEKIKLLRDLSNIFVIKEVPFGKQKKYKIIDVYDSPLIPWYDKDEWYQSIKNIICKMIQDNNEQPVWFTRTPLLNKIGAVNKNYTALMNKKDREKLEKIKDRDFTPDFEACLAIGDILSDRVYDTLRRMSKDRIIKFIDGYALKVWKNGKKNFITVSGLDENKSQQLYKLFFQIDNIAIDNVLSVYAPKRHISRGSIKQQYFQQVIKYRNMLIQDEKIKQTLTNFGYNIDTVEELYDVKFILSDDRLVEQELKNTKKAKKVINLASKNKILNSQAKSLKRYDALLPGIVETYINSETIVNYEAEVKNEKSKRQNIWKT